MFNFMEFGSDDLLSTLSKNVLLGFWEGILFLGMLQAFFKTSLKSTVSSFIYRKGSKRYGLKIFP